MANSFHDFRFLFPCCQIVLDCLQSDVSAISSAPHVFIFLCMTFWSV